MRRAKYLPFLLLLFLVACATSPRGKWMQAGLVFEAAESTVITMHDKDLLTDEQVLATKPWVLAGKASLDEAETYLPAGGTEFEARLNIILAAIRELESLYLESP